ncbi:uncharacterized protein MELLADRAFT_63965 [Melampsora larici-populina 98AG31]|uniref:Uncharacterized protein n=1 Tax=Melampsora larici-populina (strain 98AG31 / pathotype 3-4-7) TaxID=747676 RepID=F4RPN5_MELLP|nr:uncharacterized protein MELLADRAFT_63965 [Melampsora larici-populina 98AG31]EGG05570.1 hypothetical protein MELLADRAFT_63965 [Melampsora larici-populina 98AG31]
MAPDLTNDDDTERKDNNSERNLRVTNSIKESYSYQALNPHLWFRDPSNENDDLTQLQDQRIAQIHYTFALKDYENCFKICLQQLESEDKNNKKAYLFDTLLICCSYLTGIDDSKVLELIELSKEHWRNVPSVGLRAATLLLKFKDEEGALLATVPAILHCGDLRIRNIIFKALSQTSQVNQIIQSFIDKLIEERSTPRLIANRLRILDLNNFESEVTWDDILHALVSLSH